MSNKCPGCGKDKHTIYTPPLCGKIILLAEENTRLKDILENLIDEDPCHHDYHGYCQAHDWPYTDPSCPQERAKSILINTPEPGGDDENDTS